VENIGSFGKLEIIGLDQAFLNRPKKSPAYAGAFRRMLFLLISYYPESILI